MGIISVDLGTTNVKVATYNDSLNLIKILSNEVKYERNGDFVEFDAYRYYQTVAETIKMCSKESFSYNDRELQIVLTGQAESLIVLDSEGQPLRKAISWLDERSKKECAELQINFKDDQVFSVTGQVSIIPTWPITKMLWLKKCEPETFSNASKYLLLKDYIQYKLTGKLCGELSIYNFSLYFDIHNKCYWEDILSYCGISTEQLPELVEPCTNIGCITKHTAEVIQISEYTTVNVGTLDHFAGMLGTGNIKKGVVSESTGTVLSIATMVDKDDALKSEGIPCHYGPIKDTYVLMSVCESGGISLEWYKNTFLKNVSYQNLNEELEKKKKPGELLFLPYLTGTNAPDYNEFATGVFQGLKTRHDEYDLALAVMEGVAHMLNENVEKMRESGIIIEKIISTGGGARSKVWSKIKAAVTECEILIPTNEEAACLGAAIIAAVDKKIFASYRDAIDSVVKISAVYKNPGISDYSIQHHKYKKLYDLLANPILGKEVL